MKVLAATLLAMVFVISGSALAGKKPGPPSKKACTEANEKAGKCGGKNKSGSVNVSKTVAAPNSVRIDSMENPSSRAPASVNDNNTH